ncbi:MAG: tyrosine recombinase XerC [Betaproteobacteria bacterium 13_1_40CM_4_64_4]|nr:MAG: tyrosine recombinase XerC [Betaproteobacteria bacterium 13_1_40CM_4_64_4]
MTASGANEALLAAYTQHLATQPARTREAYLRDVGVLKALAGEAALTALPPAMLRRFLAALHARGLSGRSLARVLSGWRAFYRFALERDPSLKDDPCAGLKAPKSARRLPAALSPDEAVRLVTIEGGDPLSIRDRALFELAYSSGLRLSELSGLDVDSVDLATGEVRVWGKGSKERIVPVGAAAREAIRVWLEVRGGLTVGDAGAMFVSRSGRRIAPRAIEKRLAEWAIKRGLGRHVHPHMLRHSFASHLLQSSGDLRAVQEMLGHASIASTQVYTHLDFQYLARIYDQAHPRARKKT